MGQDTKQIPLPCAFAIAKDLVEKMTPFCERCEIAGSIRRKKPFVKDIEIVAIPKWETADSGLFVDESRMLNRLLQWAFDAEAAGALRWIKPGTSEIVSWEPKRDGKYWRGLLGEDIKLDLFLTTPASWGIIYAIRTGSAEFSQALVTHAKRIGMPCIEGYLTNIAGERILTPEERTVFDILGLKWVEPDQRLDGRAVRPLYRRTA
jgi:DNA polymerase/3'-5' exonuclease PolX